jgi:hypothetical protein
MGRVIYLNTPRKAHREGRGGSTPLHPLTAATAMFLAGWLIAIGYAMYATDKALRRI